MKKDKEVGGGCVTLCCLFKGEKPYKILVILYITFVKKMSDCKLLVRLLNSCMPFFVYVCVYVHAGQCVCVLANFS